MKNLLRVQLSLTVFGIYMTVLGLLMLFVPNMLLSVFQIQPTTEPWIRTTGFLAFSLGTLYLYAVKHNDRYVYQWSVPIRFTLFVFFLVMIITGQLPYQTLLIGGWDALAAVWTLVSLQLEKTSSKV